jgi:hypothetical protein
LISRILHYLPVNFSTPSHSSENRLLASSGPSLSIGADPTGPIYVKFDIRDLYENLSRNSTFCPKLTKISDGPHAELNAFHCCRRHVFATKAVLCIHCWHWDSSTIHEERIVVFPVQQWLCESATYLRHTTSHTTSNRRAFEGIVEVRILYYTKQCITVNTVEEISADNSLALYGDIKFIWSTRSYIESKMG